MTGITEGTMGVIMMAIIATTIIMMTIITTVTMKIITSIMITTIMKIHLRIGAQYPCYDARVAAPRTMSQTIFVPIVERA